MAEQVTKAGRIIKDGVKKTVNIKGKETDLGEATLKIGWGQNEQLITIQGWRWDADKVAALKKGDTVVVVGAVTSREYNGETRHQITPDFLAIEAKPKEHGDLSEPLPERTHEQREATFIQEIDEEMPF